MPYKSYIETETIAHLLIINIAFANDTNIILG